jgi:hypothetical protein
MSRLCACDNCKMRVRTNIERQLQTLPEAERIPLLAAMLGVPANVPGARGLLVNVDRSGIEPKGK